MKLKIFITKNILEQSKNCSKSDLMVGQNCAIGLAIYALFGNKSWVSGNSITIFERSVITNLDFMQNSTVSQINLPPNAIDFIGQFDKLTSEQKIKMEPISFDIEIPEKIVDMLGLTYIHQVIELQPQLELA